MILSRLRPFIRPTKLHHQFKRNSGGNVFSVEPSAWPSYINYDRICFYTYLFLIPAVSICTALSVFVGDAILADTPEGYDPEDWECERNPVQRLLARYLMPDSQFYYESDLGAIAKENDRRILGLAIDEVERNQLMYRDYRAWFFTANEEALNERADRYLAYKQPHFRDQTQLNYQPGDQRS